MAFVKGVSGNPAGRPPLKKDLIEKLEKAGAVDESVTILIESLKNPKLKIETAKYIIEQVYGKPVQKNEVSGEDGSPIILKVSYGS